MTDHSSQLDDLLALVAGSLDEQNFERVSRAVAQDPLLRQNLQHLEQIREGVLRQRAPAQNLDAIDATKKNVLATLAVGDLSVVEAEHNRNFNASPGLGWLRKFWLIACRPANVRFTYSVVAVQAVCIVLLASNALPPLTGVADTSAMRGNDGKQLGTQPDNVFFNISFAASTPESALRALLLEIQADIVSGPDQLGQYRISVARNRSYLAQLKLREAEFVEQVLEVKPEK